MMNDFHIGNENIHRITSKGSHEMIIYIEDWKSLFAYANYSTFDVGDENSGYRLSAYGYTGNAGTTRTKIA